MSAEKGQPGWLTSESGLRVQIGKTKVFMRDDVLKHLEGPKNEVHGGAALVVQTAQRRHAVPTPNPNPNPNLNPNAYPYPELSS